MGCGCYSRARESILPVQGGKVAILLGLALDSLTSTVRSVFDFQSYLVITFRTWQTETPDIQFFCRAGRKTQISGPEVLLEICRAEASNK